MFPEHDEIDFLEWVNMIMIDRHGFRADRKLDEVVVMPVKWRTEKLRRVKRTVMDTFKPRRPNEPVIVLHGVKGDYLLDGNRRINTWVRDGDNELHGVWLVCPVYRVGGGSE